jgi:hypothetical protein
VSTADIVYEVDDDSGQSIWSRSGGISTKLATGRSPDVSPDGKSVAYIAANPNPSAPVNVTWVANIDGSGAYAVDPQTTSQYADEAPRWSPDGTHISIQRHDGAPGGLNGNGFYDIFVLTPITGEAARVTNDHLSFGPAAWSPDGARLAYSNGLANSLLIINIDGSGGHSASSSTDNIMVGDPDWAPDGNRIYYELAGYGLRYLESGNQFGSATPSAPARLLGSAADFTDIQPRVSSDGSTIIFASRYRCQLADCLGFAIYSVSALGGEPSLVLPGTFNGMAPDFVTAASSPEPPPPPATADTYVAVGDSFSSGEGTGILNFLLGTDIPWYNECHRSTKAYSYVDKSLKGMPSKYEFHACSGAIVEDFFTPYPLNHPSGIAFSNMTETHAQLDWVDSRSKIVTLTIGGNNVKFPEVMNYCATRLNFESCEKFYGGSVDGSIANLAKSAGGRVHDNLPDLFGAIKAKAPSAKVIVLGYPRLFPEKVKSNCNIAVGWAFLASDMNWINGETVKLNQVTRAAATNAGFQFVDVYNALKGHELCTRQPYVNGVVLQDKQQSFHPNVNGQKQLAKALERYLP